MIIILSLISTLIFAQNITDEIETQEQKKKIIKVQCLINGKVVSPNMVFGKNDVEITIKVFPFYEQDRKEKKELFIKDFEISLVRDGKKVANQTLFGNGSLSYLAKIAKNEDTYLIQIRDVFERTKEGITKPYAKGVIKLAYLFYDLDIFKPNLEVNVVSTNH
jgi:hypothetical protein